MKASRMKTPLLYENALYEEGFTQVGGMDEAGRGPLAGPVVACAVIMPQGLVIEGVNDSKKLSPKRRAELAVLIREAAVACGLGIVDVETIDRINILQATYLAMWRAVAALSVIPDAMLIDGPRGPELPGDIRRICLTRGDTLSHSIAAASIVAKVTRDAMMCEIHQQYPLYGFDHHKGYCTAAHVKTLRDYGPCPQHRRSFKVRELINDTTNERR